MIASIIVQEHDHKRWHGIEFVELWLDCVLALPWKCDTRTQPEIGGAGVEEEQQNGRRCSFNVWHFKWPLQLHAVIAMLSNYVTDGIFIDARGQSTCVRMIVEKAQAAGNPIQNNIY